LLIVLFPFGRHAVHSRCKAVRICILKTAAIPHIITQFWGCVNPNAANAVQYKIYSFLKANLTTKRRRSKMFSVRRNYANTAFICTFFSSL